MPLSPIFECDSCAEDVTVPDAPNPVQDGYIEYGAGLAVVGEAWHDTMMGADYGAGRRYEFEETRCMAKVESRHGAKHHS